MLFVYLLVYLAPALAGAGAMVLLERRRGSNPVDYGPWKMMAAMTVLPTLLLIAAIVWMSLIPMDHTEFREAITLRAKLIEWLSLVIFLMPGAYIAAAVTGAVMGVARRRAYALVFTCLAPIVIFGWFILNISLACVTTGSCL